MINEIGRHTQWEEAYSGWRLEEMEVCRPNTYASIKKVLKKSMEYDSIIPVSDVGAIIAPLQCKGYFQPILSESKGVIYLSPDLEKVSQDDSDYYVAHELAHIALNHHRLTELFKDDKKRLEIQAHELAQKWGFKKPKSFK